MTLRSVEEADREERTTDSPPELGFFNIPNGPTSKFVQKTWYDSLLDLYARWAAPTNAGRALIASADARTQAHNTIVSDLRFLFRRSNWWFSFIHTSTFWSNFHNSERRSSSAVQPGLIYAALAMATFLKSNEMEGGRWGREMAAELRDQAQAAIDNSISVNWVDIGLAQAAWVRNSTSDSPIYT